MSSAYKYIVELGMEQSNKFQKDTESNRLRFTRIPHGMIKTWDKMHIKPLDSKSRDVDM